MTDPSRVLRPLDEAEHAIHMLEEYRTADELGRAVVDSWRAVDRSLRLLLRSDPEVPDELRLAALSPDELPLERLLNALRNRGLISLELAGSAHELGRAAERAQHGDVRAADGDLALHVVARLREEVTAPRPSEPEKEPLVVVGAGEEGVEPETGVTIPPERWSGARRLTIAAAAVSVLVLVAFLFVLVRWFDDRLETAIAAFAAGRLDEAEATFQDVLEDAPEDVTVLLYLGRINRRQGDYAAAADYLRRAARLAPNDPVVRRELGHLFMELDRPTSAAAQYQRALEADPGDERAWVGLILALRAAGDPRAEELLRQAPPSVRAVLTRGE